MRKHAIEPIRPGHGSVLWPFDAACRRLPNPAVAHPGFDHRHRTARLGQALPCRRHQFANMHSVPRGQGAFRVAADIQQQPPNQEGWHTIAQSLVNHGRFTRKSLRPGQYQGPMAEGRFFRAICQLIDGFLEAVQSFVLVRLYRHNRNAQLPRQLLWVQAQTLALSHVGHVQSDDDRHVQLHRLGCQIEIAFEVGSIDDGDDDIGPRFARLLAQDEIDSHHFIGTAGARL